MLELRSSYPFAKNKHATIAITEKNEMKINDIYVCFMFLTLSSPRKFWIAPFVRPFAQKVTAKICPVELLVIQCLINAPSKHRSH